MKPGETRTIEVTFPAEYGVPTVAGKTASFEVTAHSLNRAVVPALDDELAKKLGFDDLAAMREMVSRPHPGGIRPARPAAPEAAVAGCAGGCGDVRRA